MMIFALLLHDAIRRADQSRLRRTLRGSIRARTLAGFFAAGVLLSPALVGAAAQDAKPEPKAAAATAPAVGSTKVSPYSMANRKHAEASTASHAHSTKHAPGQPPVKPIPVRSERQ